MSQPVDPALRQISEDHTKRLFETFEVRSRGFRTLILGLCIFSLAFFLFILFPYVAMQSASARSARRLEQLGPELQGLERQIELLEQVQQGMHDLQARIDQGPATLRSFLSQHLAVRAGSLPPESLLVTSALAGQPPNSALPPAPDTGPLPKLPTLDGAGSIPFTPVPNLASNPAAQFRTDLMSSTRPMGELAREQVGRQLTEYETIVEEQIAGPLEQLSSGGQSSELNTLRANLKQLRASVDQRLDEKPTFWTTVTGKGEFFGTIDDEFEKLWKDFPPVDPAKIAALVEAKREKEQQRQEFETQRAAFETQRRSFDARLEKIQSPLGSLPVGVSESILAFPVLLAIGWVIAAFQFRDLLSVRGELFRTYRQRDPEQQVFSDRQFALLAPIWLDPLTWRPAGPARALLLAVPPVLFLAAVGCVAYSWTISQELAVVPYSQTIYAVLYGLGFLAMARGCAVTYTALRMNLGDNRQSMQN